MKNNKVIKCLLAISVMSLASLAHAGPRVDITFKNNGSMDAVYDVVGSSSYSYAEASPKPLAIVKSGTSNTYAVKGQQSSDVTTVIFQYRMGNKVCKFKTSYVRLPVNGSVPKWNKSAEASGGARCDVKVTSTNLSSHDWAVEFVMR